MNMKNTSPPVRRLIGRERHWQRGWNWLLVPRPFDAVSSSLYIGVLLTDLFFSCPCHSTWGYEVLIACAILALLSIDRLEYWLYGEETPGRPAVFLLLTRVLLIELVAQLDMFNLSPFLYLIPPFLAMWYFGNRVGYLLTSLAWIVYVSKKWLESGFQQDNGVTNLILFTLGLILAVTMARAVIKEKKSRMRAEELLARLEASHRQLQASSEQVAELATAKERNRLARDIHDTLGHYLTVINVQLEKACAFRSRSPEAADQAISDAKRLASEALQDVRRSVSALRAPNEAFSCCAAITELVEHVRSQSLLVEVRIEGNEKSFPRQALIALYRAAQEGLTNIQKHARASSVKMEICFTEAEASLSLRDNGNGFQVSLLAALRPGRERHYGLQGVQERLELIGGHMRIESHPDKGTHLFVALPKDPLADQVTLTRSSFSLAQEDEKKHGR